MKSKRRNRLKQDIKRYLSSIIHNDVKDPRMNEHVSITEVIITDDMQLAKVYISTIGSDKNRKETVEILNKAKGYIRKELSSKLTTRITPELNFYLDESVENGIRINELLKGLENNQE
jgi:ribosome-binding factor A